VADPSGGRGGPAPAPSDDGWSAHEAQQRRAWARTTARQRLAWLEDAKRFVARVRVALRSRSAARPQPQTGRSGPERR